MALNLQCMVYLYNSCSIIKDEMCIQAITYSEYSDQALGDHGKPVPLPQ